MPSLRCFAAGPRLSVFIRHFQKEQVCKLLHVIAVSDAIIPEGVAERTNLTYYD